MAQEDPITDKLSTLVTLPIQTYDNITHSPDNLRIISDVVIKPLSDTSFYIVDPNDATNNGNLVQLLTNNNNNNLILLNIPTDEPINDRNDVELVKSTSLDVIVEKTNDNTKPITIYRCTRCDEEFKKFNLYKKHIMWHNNMKKFKCDKCSISYNIEENLNIHRAVHNDGKPTCPICKISFQRLASLKSHLIVHQIEELYKCEECLSEFEREEELGKHLQTHLSTAKEKDGTVCSYCRVKFTDSNLYKEHIAHHVKVKKMILPGRRARRNQHKREYNHCCGVCQKSFSKASLLERHSRVHSGEKPFICHYCNRGFNQKGALQIHVTKHTGIKPYCCTLCSAEFYQKGNLRVHVEKTHTAPLPGIQTYKCSHCPCIFKKVSSLNVHITKTHVNNQNPPNMIDLTVNKSKSIETINDCDNRGNNNNKQENGNDNINYIRVAESFSDGTTRRYLIKQKRVNNTRIYICNYCPKEFKKPSDLIRHTRVHTRERPFLCKYCNIAFSLKSTLLSHLKTHSGKCHYSCPVCMKKFSTSRALNLHIKTHPDQLTQPFKCNPCNKWFSSVQKMLLHKEKHHGQYEDCIETPIVVEPVKIVGDLTIESTNIKQQASSLSPNDEQYECQICRQRFAKLCNLKQHMNMHLNDKNCKCDECHKLFSTADALKEHKLLHHNNSRLYHCSDCNRKFTSLSLLKQHRLSPTLPYKCTYCDRAFCTILLYRRHVIVHKNNGDFDENRTNSSTIDPDSMINSDNLSINNNSNVNEINRKYEENIQQEENSILDHHLYQLIPNQIQITTNNNDNNNSNSGDNIKGKDQVQILINCDDLQFGDNGHLYAKNDEGTDSTFFNQLDFQDGNVFNIDNLNNEFEHILNTTNNIIDNNNKSGQLNENLLNNSVENFSTPVANVIVDPSSLSIFNNNNLQTDNSNTNDNDVKLNSEKVEKNKNKRKYICPYCRRTITNKSTYSKHLDNHIKRKKDEPVLRICNYCNKSFKKQSDLVRHIRTHTGERPFSCDECDKSFSLKSTLLSHQRTHNPINSKKILCSICNSSFTSKSSLKVHMSLHTGIKPFDCTYCPMKFRTLSHRKYHEASQHHCSVNNGEEELLRIKTIDRDFLSSNLINENQSDMITTNVVTEQHLNETNDNILVVQESLQLPILINDDNLNLNESVQLESNILQWSNNLLLQDTLLQPSSLIQLDDGTLLNIKTINNDIDLVTNQNLVENQLINNQQEEEQQQQQAPAESQQQIDTVNGKPRTFKCDICNKMYASKDVLRRHRKNHGINKKFPCSKCDKGFDTEDALEKHSKLHSGYRPYTCMYCNNSFSKQQSLSAHMKRIHKLPNNSWKNDVFFTFST